MDYVIHREGNFCSQLLTSNSENSKSIEDGEGSRGRLFASSEGPAVGPSLTESVDIDPADKVDEIVDPHGCGIY